jgi:hypothetical protein
MKRLLTERIDGLGYSAVEQSANGVLWHVSEDARTGTFSRVMVDLVDAVDMFSAMGRELDPARLPYAPVARPYTAWT